MPNESVGKKDGSITLEATKVPRQQEVRFYRANKSNNGVALAFQLAKKPKGNFLDVMVFMSFARQTGYDENGNGSFDWQNSIKVKLGETDISELLAVADRRKPQVGTKGSLFHKTAKGDKTISFSKTDNGYSLGVSSRDTGQEPVRMYTNLSDADICILSVMLKKALEVMYGW
jgi:hypothetical protein